MRRVSYTHHKHVSQSLNESATGNPEEEGEEDREGKDNSASGKEEEKEEVEDGEGKDNASSVERSEIKKVKNGQISTGNVYRRSRLLKDSLFDYFEKTTISGNSERSRCVLFT